MSLIIKNFFCILVACCAVPQATSVEVDTSLGQVLTTVNGDVFISPRSIEKDNLVHLPFVKMVDEGDFRGFLKSQLHPKSGGEMMLANRDRKHAAVPGVAGVPGLLYTVEVIELEKAPEGLESGPIRSVFTTRQSLVFRSSYFGRGC